MEIAFTIARGENEGKYLRELNPNYQKEINESAKEINRVRDQFRK